MESQWGTIPVGQHNYYGIQGKSAHGSTLCATHEQRHGKLVAERHEFRNYTSLGESVDDFGRFLNVNPRYAATFTYINDAEAFFKAVAQAGYATISSYEQLILPIMRSHGIEAYDHER